MTAKMFGKQVPSFTVEGLNRSEVLIIIRALEEYQSWLYGSQGKAGKDYPDAMSSRLIAMFREGVAQ